MAYLDSMGTRGERLKKARKDAGYRTATDAARALGIPYPTYAAHENGSRQYEADEAVVYARKFKVPIEWLLTGKGGVVTPLAKSPLASVPIIGIVRAGIWQDINAGDNSLYEVVPAAPDAPAEWQYAFTVEGTSLDKIAKPGDILVCLDCIKSRIDIQDGDLVIVEWSRFGGQMVERTAKRIRRAISGIELWPESNDPDFQEPLMLDGAKDGDTIEVRAKVLWIMKRP
jgi:SOS-response transcriptional repressor LexA